MRLVLIFFYFSKKHLKGPNQKFIHMKLASRRVLTLFAIIVFMLITGSYFFIRILILHENMKHPAAQVCISRVSLMPNAPSQFNLKDWKALTKAYISFVFNFSSSSEYLPLVKLDKTDPRFISFDLPSYVGQNKYEEGSGEAINCIAAVLSATLVDINMSNYNGYDWVSMTKKWFSEEDGIFLNNKNGQSGSSFWYDIYPNVLIYSLLYYYPTFSTSWNQTLYRVADGWYNASYVMYKDYRGPDFTAFNFRTMKPINNYMWTEPDAAAGMAWIEYIAYNKWKDSRFLEATKWNMQFLQDRTSNPFYEVLLPFGAYIAARMNAELGTNYDVQKLLNWCFDGNSISRPGWGVIVGNWGGYEVNGLVGSITDGGGYAFTMNTFSMAIPLIPLVRYDTRFAKDVGKWMLNVANNARLFYPDALSPELQSSAFWKGDPNHVIAYEGLRKSWNGKSPYATGDALRNGWAATDFGLYGSSYVGVFGGIINPTSDERILQLDCLKTDFYHNPAYPTYLYYNPYNISKSVAINVGPEPKDLYDAVSHKFLVKNTTNTAIFNLSPESAAVIVVVPAEGQVQYVNEKMLINGIVVDFNINQ